MEPSKPTQISSKLDMVDLLKLVKQPSKKRKAKFVTAQSEEVQNLIGNTATIAKRFQNHLKNSPGEFKGISTSAQLGPPFNKEQTHQSESSNLATLNQNEVIEPTHTNTKMDSADVQNHTFELDKKNYLMTINSLLLQGLKEEESLSEVEGQLEVEKQVFFDDEEEQVFFDNEEEPVSFDDDDEEEVIFDEEDEEVTSNDLEELNEAELILKIISY